MQPSVLILGGRGRLGLAAAKAFAAAGWRVQAMVRRAATTPDVDGLRWLPLDLQDIDGLSSAVGQVDVIVHALNPSSYANRHWSAQAPVFMDRAIALSLRLKATLMFPGNVYNFGRSMPEVLTESTPQQPDTSKGRIRADLEQRLAQAAQRDGLRSVVIRAGDFFGAGRGSWFDLVMAKRLAKGRLTLPGGLDTPTPWAYVPDLARCFVKVAQRREQLAPFEVLHFPGVALSGRDWQQLLGAVLSQSAKESAGQARPLRTSHLPWWLLRLGATVLPEWDAMLEMRYLWQTPHRLLGERLQALLGEIPNTPSPLAVARTLRELGQLAPVNGSTETTPTDSGVLSAALK